MDILNNKYNYFLVVICSLIVTSIQLKFVEMGFPNSLTLQDNSIVLLGSKGIYFYDKDFTMVEKSFPFNETLIKPPFVLMKEFSKDNGGYIVILMEKNVNGSPKKVLYIFSSTKTEVKLNIELDDNNVKQSEFLDLIPYKLDGNDLYFILPYIYNGKINL